MTQLEINGQRQEIPNEAQGGFGMLMNHVHASFAVGGKVVSGVRVNGISLADGDEKALADFPMADIQTVEVDVRDARNLASETLEVLDPFLDQLSGISIQCLGTPDLNPLIEGVSVLTDSLHQIGTVLNEGGLGAENEALVQELSILLSQLVLESENGETHHRRDRILATQLPALFERWRSEGLPALQARLASA
jgi:hypothetical protein